MKPSQAERIIQELTEKINQYNREYYNQEGSGVDDEMFDTFLEQLTELEHKFPEFRREDSPTMRVGGEPTRNFENAPHQIPLLSLSNVYLIDELKRWIASIKSQLPDDSVEFVCELKIDGLAIAIEYENGMIRQAITRGNGEIGDDVTANVKTIQSLPLKLNREVSIHVRGEIFFTLENFEKINKVREGENQSLFKNPRNAAAGTIRMKDPKRVSRRGLDILLYDIVAGETSTNHSENLAFMEKLGLPVNGFRVVCQSADQVISFCETWEAQKETLPFEIDGIVIKVENLHQRRVLGVTSKSPKWARAWKFKAEKARSKLLGVENAIGRTGILTPVANLEPIKLMGTVVKRATLHNYDQISRLGIHENDTLFVEKGGEIIPKIVGVDYSQREEDSTPLVPPTECPVCASVLTKRVEEVDLRCENPDCPAIIEGALRHFVSKPCMDIQSFGSSLIHQLIDKGLVKKISDIYTLIDKKGELLQLDGLGEKSITTLLDAIEDSKKKPLNRFIGALGIRHIGERAAMSLAIASGSIDGIKKLSMEELENIPDFGTKMAVSVIEWLGKSDHKVLLEELTRLGLDPAPLKPIGRKPFENQRVVITGTLSTSRREWRERLEDAGFKVVSSVSKKTDYLLAGESAGSKLNKAKQHNIPILDESKMVALLERGER